MRLLPAVVIVVAVRPTTDDTAPNVLPMAATAAGFSAVLDAKDGTLRADS